MLTIVKKIYSPFLLKIFFFLLVTIFIPANAAYLSILWPMPQEEVVKKALVDGTLKLELSYGTYKSGIKLTDTSGTPHTVTIVKDYGIQGISPINPHSDYQWNEYYHPMLAIYNPKIINNGTTLYRPTGGPGISDKPAIQDEELKQRIIYLISDERGSRPSKDEVFWIIYDTHDEFGNVVLKLRNDGSNRQLYDMGGQKAAAEARRLGKGDLIWLQP